MKKALVTGGAGFIGSHIVEGLLYAGWDVAVVDRKDQSAAREKLGGFLDNVRYFQRDLREDLSEQLKGVEVVCHQGAEVSVPRSREVPYDFLAVNDTGMYRLLEAAAKQGVRRVVFASSSSVYGDEAPLPQDEEGPTFPKSLYATTKLAGEGMLRTFSKGGNLETVALRYFNVYGPRQDVKSRYSAVIPIFIVRTLQGTPAVINGDGEQSRDFMYVKDVAEANLKALTLPGLNNLVLNVCEGKTITVNQLHALIQKLLGKEIPAEYAATREGDIKISQGNPARIKKHLNFTPQFSTEQGLQETIAWFKEQYEKGNYHGI